MFVSRNYMRGIKCPSDNKINGQIAIVTGANSGIGYEIAKELILRGLAKLFFLKRVMFNFLYNCKLNDAGRSSSNTGVS